MRIRIFFCLVAVSLSIDSFSQEIYSIDSVIWVEDSATKTELYSRAKVWFTETFVDANSVIELDDSESGIIIGNGRGLDYVWPKFTGSECYTGELSFMVKVYLKDGRFKIELTSFKHSSKSSGGDCNLGLLYTEGFLNSNLYNKEGKNWVKMQNDTKGIAFESAQSTAIALISSISQFMNQPVESSNDDW